MLQLRTLGSLDLRSSDGIEVRPVLAQPKRMALLAYLAVARPRGLHRRDRLIALFWPEVDEARARRALSQALTFLRNELPEPVLHTRGAEEVGVLAEALTVDAVVFERALEAGRFQEALELYGGDFLSGFHAGDAWGFDEWASAERDRLRKQAADCAWALAREQLDQGAVADAEGSARRALDLQLSDESAVREFVGALAATGDRAAAVRFYERFAEALAEELELRPHAETRKLVDDIRMSMEVGVSGAAPRRIPPRRNTERDPTLDRLRAALADRYVIKREIGRGGMATVYLADDLKHERRVAVKVLSPELTSAVGVERFLAEIKTTAQLQHPHILPLFDSGESDGVLFYVMPYVEGERSLRQRLDREGPLPVDEAVRIGSGIAAALDYAHRNGVIHRDIKPGNVLFEDGQSVVADFGIALAVHSAGQGRLTGTGFGIGTPHYMSPEQATGERTVGEATDIYALGCVLYEMLVGEPPYPGTTVQAVLGKIIAGGPVSAAEHRRSVPPHVDAAVRKALEKLPADRFATASEFGRALGDASFRYGRAGGSTAPADSEAPWRRRALAAIAVAALGWATVATLRPWANEAPLPQVIRFTVPVDPADSVHLGHQVNAGWGRPGTTALTLSPDGDALVYEGWRRRPDDAYESRLYLRRLDQEAPTLIPGTGDGRAPFFSPDGRWVAFFQDGGLRRVSLETGEIATVIIERQWPPEGYSPWDWRSGGSWSEEGFIFFVDTEGRILRVPQAGGDATVVRAAPEEGDVRISRPRALPGGRILLFDLLYPGGGKTDESEIRALQVDTGEEWAVLTNAFDGRLAGGDRLLFMRDGVLMATSMDVESGRVQGPSVPVLDNVMHALAMPHTDWITGAGQFAFSTAGHLAYVPGGIFPELSSTVVRVTPGGGYEVLDVEPREYLRVRVSPDGRSLALVAGNRPAGYQLFVHDLDRGVTRRLPTGTIRPGQVEWSPDGVFVAYRTESGDSSSLRRIAAAGGSPPEVLDAEASNRELATWAPTGEILYYDGAELWSLDPQGERRMVAAFGVFFTLSPDGRWLAYSTNETGRLEVYVRPYPGPGAPTLVSIGGGHAPVWARDGRRLYYIDDFPRIAPPRIMAVGVTLGDTFQAGVPTTVVDPWDYIGTVIARAYDVAPDGSLIGLSPGWVSSLRDRYAVDQIHVILNFAGEIRRRFNELGGTRP